MAGALDASFGGVPRESAAAFMSQILAGVDVKIRRELESLKAELDKCDVTQKRGREPAVVDGSGRAPVKEQEGAVTPTTRIYWVALAVFVLVTAASISAAVRWRQDRAATQQHRSPALVPRTAPAPIHRAEQRPEDIPRPKTTRPAPRPEVTSHSEQPSRSRQAQLKASAEDFDSQLQEARRLVRNGMPLRAEDVFVAMERKPGGGPYAAVGRAHLLLQQGQYEASIDAASIAVNSGIADPLKSRAFVIRANAKLQEGDRRGAVHDFEDALRLDAANQGARDGLRAANQARSSRSVPSVN
jgi:hypothetical protein